MNFSISKQRINPNYFNNQQFIILGRILIPQFAWKLFFLNSFGHLGHFALVKIKQSPFFLLL